MPIFKLANKIYSIGDDIHMLAELDHTDETGRWSEPVVAFQSRNRRDSVDVVAGKPIHIKHGVYVQDPLSSEKFKWFLKVFGTSIGLIDVDESYNHRDQIEDAIAKIKAQQSRQPPVP
jgi:Tfp pilus assembly protein PilZ